MCVNIHLFTIETQHNSISKHCNHILSILRTANPEIRLQNEAVVIMLEQPLLLPLAKLKT